MLMFYASRICLFWCSSILARVRTDSMSCAVWVCGHVVLKSTNVLQCGEEDYIPTFVLP